MSYALHMIEVAAKNFRGLRDVRWRLLPGLNALVGPNGSGKTTLGHVPELLRSMRGQSIEQAIASHGGAHHLKHVDAPLEEPITLALRTQSQDWTVQISDGGGRMALGEEVRIGATTYSRALGTSDFRGPKGNLALAARDWTGLQRLLHEDPKPDELERVLDGYRLYRDYALSQVRRPQESSHNVMSSSGENVIAVLHKWHGRRETRTGRLDFVLGAMQECFPDTFLDIDFDLVGPAVFGQILAPGDGSKRYGVHEVSNGLLVALLHLTAVAAIPKGGFIVLDEPENGLHPSAIKRLFGHIDRRARDENCAIALATHSPVVIDLFREAPERLCIMNAGGSPTPVTTVEDADWLRQFSLGDLYSRGEIGGPQRDVAE